MGHPVDPASREEVCTTHLRAEFSHIVEKSMQKQEGQHRQEDVVDGADVTDLKQFCQQRLPRHEPLPPTADDQRSGQRSIRTTKVKC